jgi:hypothetical protein
MTDDVRCPVCGLGVVRDIAYDAEANDERGRPFQDPEARQIIEYTCGHSSEGPRLATADQDRLDVERRASEDTTDPLEDEQG